jgi:hypothetical protein
MVWHDWKTGPTADPAAADVLAAYEAAWKARKSTADCYTQGSAHGAKLTRIKRRCTPRKGGVGDPRGEGHPAYTG